MVETEVNIAQYVILVMIKRIIIINVPKSICTMSLSSTNSMNPDTALMYIPASLASGEGWKVGSGSPCYLKVQCQLLSAL